MALHHLLPPSPSSCPSLHFKFKPKSKHFITNLHPTLPLKPNCPIQSSKTHATASDHFSRSLSSFDSIVPYVQSQWRPILAGWACSAVSVFSLSLMVPKIGRFSAMMGAVDAVRVREEALVLGALALVRLVATYWQQAFLWDAALKTVYGIRVYVFERVLQRDLGFFEGISAGDIAYRITAEASDVAETVYALLNTVVPSILQLSAMATQMLVISPVLSSISALVSNLSATLEGDSINCVCQCLSR